MTLRAGNRNIFLSFKHDLQWIVLLLGVCSCVRLAGLLRGRS